MSAVNPLQPNSQPGAGAAADKRVYEPSMEEILASIRRIIADDQSLPGRAAALDNLSAAEPEAHQDPVSASKPASPSSETPAPSLGHLVDARPPTPIETSYAASHLAEAPDAPLAVAAPLTLGSIHDASEPVIAPSLKVEGPAPLETRPSFVVEPIEAPAVAEPMPDAPLAHGFVAAPQFAMPDGPVNDDARLEPAAPLPPQAAASPPPADEPEPEDDLLPYDAPTEPPLHQASPLGHADVGAGLFSAATDSVVGSAFNMLAASRLADNSEELMTLAREMIRPLLRTWIDDNLPSMVERMVRAEIERVARGGR